MHCEQLRVTVLHMSNAESDSAQYPHDAAWHERRRLGIGGSDVAALFGCSPYHSAYSLWLEKTGQAPEDDGEEPIWLKTGRALEPLTRQLYTQLTGREVTSVHEYVIDDEFPYMRCELDGRQPGHPVYEGEGVFEGKTTQAFLRGEWEGDTTPLWYQCQVQHAMMITGCKWATIGCLVMGSSEPLIYRDQARNDTFIRVMRGRIQHFWTHNVVGMQPPEIDGHRATTAAIKAMHPDDSGHVIELSQDFQDLWDQLADYRGQTKDIQKAMDKTRNLIKLRLGTASYGQFPDGRGVTYRTQETAARMQKGSKFRALRAVSARSMARAAQDAPKRDEERDTAIIKKALAKGP